MAPEVLTALEDMLDRREQRAEEKAARRAGSSRVGVTKVEGATSRPAPSDRHPRPPAASGISSASQRIGNMTKEELLRFVKRQVKEEKGGHVLAPVRDRDSHPLDPELLSITVPHRVRPARIDIYRGQGDPVEHVQNHEASLL